MGNANKPLPAMDTIEERDFPRLPGVTYGPWTVFQREDNGKVRGLDEFYPIS